MAKKRKLRSRSRLIIFIAAVVLILASGVLLASEILNPSGWEKTSEDKDDEKVVIEGRKNVLLLGVDTRAGEEMARADTIMLASLDADLKKAVIVSIPRDTRVEIPRHGMDKINAATVYGGPELLVETVSDLFNIHMDGYVLCDYPGFIEIIDALGGVTIDVKEDMHHYDPADNGIYSINLAKGRQHLDGNKALQFVRYRGYDLGDITRTEQQQQFLYALAEKVIQTNTLTKLPKLVPAILENVKTNLGLSEIMTLAKAAKNFKDIEITCQTLPGYFLTMDELSYWETDLEEARTLIARLYEGETVDEVVWGSKVIETNIASSGENPVNGTLPDPAENNQGGELDNNLQEDPDIEITPVSPGENEGAGEAGDWWNDENIDEWWDTGEPGNAGGTGNTGDTGDTGTNPSDGQDVNNPPTASPDQEPAAPETPVTNTGDWTGGSAGGGSGDTGSGAGESGSDGTQVINIL